MYCKICKKLHSECGKKDSNLYWIKQGIFKIGLTQKQMDYLNKK